MRKNSFLTFCFAFIPGAGQMYLGLMKKGAAIMTAFFSIIGIAGYLRLEFLLFLLPVLWFYAFFETLNLRWMSPQEIKIMDDKFSLDIGFSISHDWKSILEKRHAVIGAGLLFLGLWMILQNFIMPVIRQFDIWWLENLMYRLPSIFVSVAIIVLGIHLIKGKKKTTATEDDFVAYKGEHDE